MAHRFGYLMIDHRASPGLPEDMAIQLGLDPRFTGEGKLFEADTVTCAHCRTAFIKNTLRQRERAQCAKCGYKYVCDWCAEEMKRPDYVHMSHEKIRDVTFEQAIKAAILGTSSKLLIP